MGSNQSKSSVKYPGIPVTTNGNTLVSYYTEARLADAGIFFPITPSTEMGELFEFSFAKGEPNVFGKTKMAIETEGEHAAQAGAIMYSVTGKRVTNFTSGQGLLYGIEQYYHAPAKFSTMVLEVGARALTKHALNVHCGHDDVYAAFDTGWIILFSKDAQQAADQALILRRVTEKVLNPGINAQDGFLTTHLDRTFYKVEAELIREFLGAPEDIIDCPTPAQKELFGPKRRRIPEGYDLKNPILLGSVQNQEHYMNGIAARRNNFPATDILKALEESYDTFAKLTGRSYGLISEYNTEKADTVFVTIGSSAENIEAAIDYIRERDKVEIGGIHINVLRPFPEKAIVNALKGKKNVIILERTDELNSPDNPITRDIRTSLSKAIENAKSPIWEGIPAIAHTEVPQIYTGVYGLGSRDFRPEHILGAYEYVSNRVKRQDGQSASQAHFFYLGINHPYAVISKDTPSLLPNKSIAIRFHSIGGWGAITTGKNLSELLGDLGQYIKKRDNLQTDPVHISANPKYGSEKKGAPTNYFLVAAPERIKVNCDLRHVDAVLCCDPKAFTHTNPVEGIKEGGAFIWESDETDSSKAWQRIPKKYRQTIIDKKIQVYTLHGFDIAQESTNRPELQLRMQGNAFLGAFFKVSGFLNDNNIPDEQFLNAVEEQYRYKFGKLGDAVINSNMKVMKSGFSQVQRIAYGEVDAPDTSLFTSKRILPMEKAAVQNQKKANLFSKSYFESEFRGGYGYHQPASELASTGIVAAGTGSETSKYVARRMVPQWNSNKCIQCMDCMTVCPDNALPSMAHDIKTILQKTISHYVTDASNKKGLLNIVDMAEKQIREVLVSEASKKENAESFSSIAIKKITELAMTESGLKNAKTLNNSLEELSEILKRASLAYSQTGQIFSMKEKKEPGSGGLFGIFVSDLCKGCGQCVKQCGSHEALKMVIETEAINGDHHTGTHFYNLFPDTPTKYLGLYDAENPTQSKAATLKNHLLQRSKYSAMVCGDGSCAGCGEKSVLRAVSSLTEAYMRPLYHAKADRLTQKATQLKQQGVKQLDQLQKANPKAHQTLQTMIAHLISELGGENDQDTQNRIQQNSKLSHQTLIETLSNRLNQEAVNHKDLQTIEGTHPNGMSVMGMTASTGCNTVYGSTPPANPHTYPWMNSLFQDGASIGWLASESFNQSHIRNSVIPERVADLILSQAEDISENLYFDLVHLTDKLLTDLEIKEMPKVWAIGGDGGLGDIGFQNVSKTILQNRPNYQCLMLDTQVYSNTGGQNSDSSVMPGGFDMNQYGAGSQGKLTEKKEVAQIFCIGHGSPYIAQVSMANAANFFKSILDGLDYRGAAFIQSYTPCMPEHGIGDDVATIQAQRARDSRGMVEFIWDSSLGETDADCLNLKANPTLTKDWAIKSTANKEKYQYTVAHWAATESRFRNHIKKAPDNYKTTCVFLEDILWRVTQDDVVQRRIFNHDELAYIPDFNVYFYAEQADGTLKPFIVSRQMVLFCIERRKNWRRIQSRAGIVNEDYQLQKAILTKYKAGEITKKQLVTDINSIVEKYRQTKEPISVS